MLVYNGVKVMFYCLYFLNYNNLVVVMWFYGIYVVIGLVEFCICCGLEFYCFFM